MAMVFDYTIEGGNFSQAGTASSQVKKILKQLNLPPSLIKRVAVAMYESEVNIVAHAYRRTMHVDIDGERVFMRFADEGPGIEDIDKAMQEGYSTASEEVMQMGFGAGMGLPNIRRNADKLHVESVPGKGTLVEITTFIKS